MLGNFYYANNYPTHRSRILLVIPPALKDNWQQTLKKFRIDDAFTIITNGSLAKISDAKIYDMVIVDEAHKFRNNTADAYDLLQIICKTPNEEDEAKKVMLISATPLNNRPQDLYNQILLFQDGNNSTLGLALAQFFSKINKDYKAIIDNKKLSIAQAKKKTRLLYEKIREQVLTLIMVRRTRADLYNDNNKRYKKDLDNHSIKFPYVIPPKQLLYQLPKNIEDLYDKTIQIIHDKSKKNENSLRYSRYRILHYLKPQYKDEYKTPEQLSEQLAALMKTLLLKRMDSSFYAFKKTLGNFIKTSNAMLKMIDNKRIIIAPNLNVSEYILAGEEEKLLAKIVVEKLTDPSIKIVNLDDFEDNFVPAIKNDHQILLKLQKEWQQITYDPKLRLFLTQLDAILTQKDNIEQKVIIFTESIDTMNYLKNNLAKNIYKDKLLSISSNNYNSLKKTIKDNFDANISMDDKKNDYQILITTEVLAEGINLHRANCIINYDTPWNSTRLIQRIGRINRIGSKAEYVFIYNFLPTSKVDKDIDLEKKALIKLQAFHSALGEDAQVYSPEEEVDSFAIFDPTITEERNESLEYLEKIRQFRKQNPEIYKHLKDVPNKVRCATKNKDYKNSTITFIRNSNKSSTSFYLVGNKIDNITFLKATKILECDGNTKGVALPKKHYEQVNLALNTFTQQMLENIITNTLNKHRTLSPSEKTAIKFLKTVHNLSQSNEREKSLINAAIDVINNKSLSGINKEINKLRKNIAKTKTAYITIIEYTIAIIKKNNINPIIADKQQNISIKKPQNTTPTIIISQSYI